MKCQSEWQVGQTEMTSACMSVYEKAEYTIDYTYLSILHKPGSA